MKKKFLPSLLLTSLFMLSTLSFVSAKVALPSGLTSDGYVLMDSDSGKILTSKNENGRYEPASITKVLTALIVIEKGNLNDKITAKAPAILEEGSSMYLKEGEVLTVEQLLYGLMLHSANDAAATLAEYISGSKEAFSKEMNKKAKELGATNSNFSNPHGLNDKNHYTTPKDFALICKGAMKNEAFRKIVSTARYQIPPTPQFPETRYLVNHNKLIISKDLVYKGANGIKTGFTKSSLHTFAGSASRNNLNLIVVSLKNTMPGHFDARALFDYGFNNFKPEVIVEANKSIGFMEDEDKKDISLIPTETVSYIKTPDNPEVITTEVDYLDIESFKPGTVVAKLNINVNGSLYKTINLKSDKEYTKKSSIGSTFDKINIFTSSKHIVQVSLFILFIVIIAIFLNIRVKGKKSRRKH